MNGQKPHNPFMCKEYQTFIWQNADTTWSWQVEVYEPGSLNPELIETGNGCKTEGIAAMKCAFVILTSEKEREA